MEKLKALWSGSGKWFLIGLPVAALVIPRSEQGLPAVICHIALARQILSCSRKVLYLMPRRKRQAASSSLPAMEHPPCRVYYTIKRHMF